jgi:hypothetical protein
LRGRLIVGISANKPGEFSFALTLAYKFSNDRRGELATTVFANYQVMVSAHRNLREVSNDNNLSVLSQVLELSRDDVSRRPSDSGINLVENPGPTRGTAR